MSKSWLKALPVAAVFTMACATASADVVAAVTATGQYSLHDAHAPIPGMATPAFKHTGGQLIATYSAECYAASGTEGERIIVDVNIVVIDAAQTKVVATLSPSDAFSAFCASGSAQATASMTGVATLPAGTYRVSVRGRLSNEGRSSGWMGARSLVVLR